MFARRNKPPITHRALDILWPRIGLKRYAKYWGHRIGRLPGTPHTIALGFAAGAGISFTPLWGLHIIVAILLVMPFRGNALAAAIGTIVGNPWTFPPIIYWNYHIGSMMLGVDPSLDSAAPMGFDEQIMQLQAWCNMQWHHLTGDEWHGAALTLDKIWHDFAPMFRHYFLPMFVAGIPTAIVMGLLHYYPIHYLIKRYQQGRVKRAAKRRGALMGAAADHGNTSSAARPGGLS